MDSEIQLKNFLNENGIKVKSVKYGRVLGVDCFLIYTCKNYTHRYLREKLGDINLSRIPKLGGESGYVLIIEADDGHKLLKGFNFLDALGEDNYEELIKNQLIINGTGKASTKVRFARGKLVLLYNTKYNSTCIAKSLNISNDAVVDVSANDCGDLKMIVLLDRVNNPWVSEPIPSIKICENDFDLEDVLNMDNPLNCIRKQLAKNCISCGVIDISSDDLIRIGTAAKTDDIAMALNIPAKSVVDLVDKKYILLDRVLRKVKSK